MNKSTTIQFTDLEPAPDDLARDALRGLCNESKSLPCKLFYDRRGSELFDRICEAPEYYLARTEIRIMQRNLGEIAAALGPQVQLIEPGSGAGTKTRILLEALLDPVAFVPIEISRQHLLESAERIADAFPDLQVQAICADYLRKLEIPRPARPHRRRVVFFPGSTIGNFHVPEARAFLNRMADLAGPGGGLLIGVDHRKRVETLLAAYDDAQGLTAEFNLNILRRLNQEGVARFQVDRFVHKSVWNEDKSRIEMHLVSTVDQDVSVSSHTIEIKKGEAIHTECSYKYGAEGVDGITDRFELKRAWTDEERMLSVQYLVVRDTSE